MVSETLRKHFQVKLKLPIFLVPSLLGCSVRAALGLPRKLPRGLCGRCSALDPALELQGQQHVAL